MRSFKFLSFRYEVPSKLAPRELFLEKLLKKEVLDRKKFLKNMGEGVHLLRRPPGCAAGKIACILIRYMFYHKEYTTLWIKQLWHRRPLPS